MLLTRCAETLKCHEPIKGADDIHTRRTWKTYLRWENLVLSCQGPYAPGLINSCRPRFPRPFLVSHMHCRCSQRRPRCRSPCLNSANPKRVSAGPQEGSDHDNRVRLKRGRFTPATLSIYLENKNKTPAMRSRITLPVWLIPSASESPYIH